ncbi:MAG: hypothetical protein JXQ90_18055 [Cyclobacteriaceae bacterium]
MKDSKDTKKDIGGQKEDHLAPTKIEEHKPVKGSEKSSGLSHAELENQFELHKRIGHLMEGQHVVQDIKARYQSEVVKIDALRTKEDINYSMGVRSDLPHAPHEAIRYSRGMADQGKRDEVNKELDDSYSAGNNLSKEFEAQQSTPKTVKTDFQKARDKGNDREM